MYKGEQITVRRLLNGLYSIQQEGHPTFIGAAASTAIALAHTVFEDEANEIPEEREQK